MVSSKFCVVQPLNENELIQNKDLDCSCKSRFVNCLLANDVIKTGNIIKLKT